jgi:hypothetical protein
MTWGRVRRYLAGPIVVGAMLTAGSASADTAVPTNTAPPSVGRAGQPVLAEAGTWTGALAYS